MNILEISNLSIAKPGERTAKSSEHYPQSMILNDISCKVSAGEVLSIIGPNGAGKSSLLRAISGDLAYEGSISLGEVPDTQPQRARHLAVLPQFSLLNFSYRVSEVVELGRIPHKSGAKIDESIVDQALAMLDISFLKHRYYTELSGGEKQRVQLARVLSQIWRQEDCAGPRLLLLDEPTTALDLGHQQQLMRIVREFASQGVAVIMVLHDINLAARYSDKLLALLCSEQVAFGKVEDVVTEQNISRLFNIDAQIIEHPNDATPHVIGR